MIGNAFAHKYVSATVDALTQAFPREKIVALGLKEDARHNVTAYASGHLTDEQMHNLLRGAKLVVFPSHYEGFGIPVVESLAYSQARAGAVHPGDTGTAREAGGERESDSVRLYQGPGGAAE